MPKCKIGFDNLINVVNQIIKDDQEEIILTSLYNSSERK